MIRVSVVPLSQCTMDSFALGDFTAADGAWVEDCPLADDCAFAPDDCAFAPEFMSNDYVRVTQLYCGAVVSRLVHLLFLTFCLKVF